ncbi:NAD(P)-binding protein [Sulfitobacter delicatus]|uniref:Dimethylamine/trimethylamine dehydrogenase n=1 Tax=Sulfitobacter delicatus TaxID=218672 RepID=A0A1G7M5Z8_9RHOB|nr:NAD(P)-binding protein [Sulfitobacter delicatus]SDF57016.1 dimethylamine/trimethylamine dehydrogenase [Sulfitobacter delicatus]
MSDPNPGPFAALFEPVKIGPLTTRNRFYQVPHCTGMGYRYPRSEARFRGIKAEGGWGVVSTQETEIHPSSDLTPANEARLWSEADIPALRLVTEAVHEHGSLAAIQLAHNGMHTANRYSRRVPLAPSAAPVGGDDPVQARAMDKADIAEFRRWHVAAAKRAMDAGFDIIYAYAGHEMTLLHQFLLLRHNQRTDEYGGSLTNRLRLFREVIADTREVVGDRCALAVRLAVDELLGANGMQHDAEARDVIEALAEEPDLWDVNLSDWSNDSQTSRFAPEGFQDDYTRFVKSVTSKPVVGVGRYTSPDTMLKLVRQGHLDLIGAARPSIADPFLPEKIRTGEVEAIRECIGCNICVMGDNTETPIRCTQNPATGEEWRRGWHPEKIAPLKTPEPVLIVGGGPAGLEAARALSQRGADVMLAEADTAWGGRVTREAALPGLAAWGRVRDTRLWLLQQRPNAELYLQSPLTAEDLLDYGMPHIALATGSRWRRDGRGRANRLPLPFLDPTRVLTPDDLMHTGAAAVTADGPVVIFDDDRFYMASVLAELLANAGHEVIFVTPAPVVSPWSDKTLEQARIQRRLIEKKVQIIPLSNLADMGPDSLTLSCVYGGPTREIPCATLVMVTARAPQDALWHDLQTRKQDWADAGIKTITRIGDCLAPSLIAMAVQSGHAYAQYIEHDTPPEPLREDNATDAALRLQL